MKQDIYLLGGIMLQAQNIYLSLYELDITTKITLSSLALTKKDYYDEMSTPIAIPHMTVEEFIHRGYYGGHVDVYMPIGDNLLYYYIHSLYLFLMKSSPMPIGVAKWDGNL